MEFFDFSDLYLAQLNIIFDTFIKVLKFVLTLELNLKIIENKRVKIIIKG